MQIVDEFGMEIGGGLVVRTPSGFAPKYSPGCPLGFRAMVATANETQQPYSVNRNTSQRLPSQRKRNSSLVHLSSVMFENLAENKFVLLFSYRCSNSKLIVFSVKEHMNFLQGLVPIHDLEVHI